MLELLTLLVLGTTPLVAQDTTAKPIDTDRPDFTDGTHTLAAGRFQLETGYTYQQARGTDAGHTHSVPEALIRIGLSSRIEMRVGDNYLVQHGDGSSAATVSGFDDLYLGTKVSLTEAHGIVPALSFELKANAPTGGAAISAHRWLPGGAILLGWEGDSPWSAGVELFATRTADDNAQGIASLSVQYQVSSNVQPYFEIYTVQPMGTGTAVGTHYANSGVLLLLSSNVQVDARVGIGLNQGSDSYFVGFGFAVRR